MAAQARKPAPVAEDAAEPEVVDDELEAHLCPHDGAELVLHGPGNPHNAGAWHCLTCGCCLRDGQLVPGHPTCPAADA